MIENNLNMINETTIFHEDPIVTFASLAHELWRNNYDPTGTKPKITKTGDGTESDINQPFDKLHPDWKRENLAAGKDVLDAIVKSKDDENAAEAIHAIWMHRNPMYEFNVPSPAPYNQLSDTEKEKYRVLVRLMKKILGVL